MLLLLGRVRYGFHRRRVLSYPYGTKCEIRGYVIYALGSAWFGVQRYESYSARGGRQCERGK
jgi:hypothetical protein